MPRLNVILYDAAIFHIFYLLLALLATTNLKGVISDGEVGSLRRGNILFFSHLIVEESFPYIANVGIRCEYRHQARSEERR